MSYPYSSSSTYRLPRPLPTNFKIFSFTRSLKSVRACFFVAAEGSIDVAHIQLQALAITEGTSLTFDSQSDATFAGASILSEQHEASIIIEEAPATALTLHKMEATSNPQRRIALLLALTALVTAMMIVRKQRQRR